MVQGVLENKPHSSMDVLNDINQVEVFRNLLILMLVFTTVAAVTQLAQGFAFPIEDGIRFSWLGFINNTDFNAWLLPDFIINMGLLSIMGIKITNFLFWLVVVALLWPLYKFVDNRYQCLKSDAEQQKVELDQVCEEAGEAVYQISGEQHLSKVAKISARINPLIKIMIALASLICLVMGLILLRQIFQPLFSDNIYAPWLTVEEFSTWQDYLVIINIVISLSMMLAFWFLCLFLRELDKILTCFKKGAVFVAANAAAVFKMAKYYLVAVLIGFPASITSDYMQSSKCQGDSFSGNVVDTFIGDFLFSDLIFIGMLFVVGHIITLAIRLDHEQRLTV